MEQSNMRVQQQEYVQFRYCDSEDRGGHVRVELVAELGAMVADVVLAMVVTQILAYGTGDVDCEDCVCDCVFNDVVMPNGARPARPEPVLRRMDEEIGFVLHIRDRMESITSMTQGQKDQQLYIFELQKLG